MNIGDSKRLIFIVQLLYAALCIGLSVILFLNKDMLTFSPWNTTGILEWSNYASGNGDRIAVIEKSQRSVLVLNAEEELIYQLDAKPRLPQSFSNAMFVDLDERNNLYVLDAVFNGAFEENVERVLKYSEQGTFLEEIYAYRYTNEDFIITKGKISGMAYYKKAIYLVRVENNGFYLERAGTVMGADPERIAYFDYPNAFGELAYCRINVENRRLVFTTKAREIKQYDFSGTLVGEWDVSQDGIPWTAISDNNNNILYSDIINNEIVFIETTTGAKTVRFTKAEGNPYYFINYANGILFATADEEKILIQGKDGNVKNLAAYSYSDSIVGARIILFAFFFIDIFAFLVFLILSIRFLPKKKFSENFKLIMLSGICIAFGTGISSVVIINEMNTRNFGSIYNDLENVSRLIASSIDTDVLTSQRNSAQISSDEYQRLSDGIKRLFSQLPFNGKRAYQYVWMEREGMVYSMYDSESALGLLFPFAEYAGSYYEKVYDSKKYLYTNDITASGSWLFACGPIFDQEGNVVALIETGYNMTTVLAQTRTMIIQTLLIVIAGTIAFLLLVIEFILINNAYTKNKGDWAIDEPMPFRPELLRAIVFIMYVAGNLATALLPMYAANLYQPLFNLPREFVITLPFTVDVVFVSLALLVVPNILKKFGLKRISLMASLFYVIGFILCFIATNTAYLAVAYAFTGFAGGAIILVVNTIIGAQKDVGDVNSGFAHFNASYLAGVNVGVVLGSILAQFFPYRLVYFFAFIIALSLFMVFIFSTRSKYLKGIYDIATEEAEEEDYVMDKKEGKFALLKFIFKPAVIGTLLLLLLPYMVSMSFTSYFVPLFGMEHGLSESNIGQLILLSGLFAILFGTTLCDYIDRKLPMPFTMRLKSVIFLSLLINAGGIFLFSFDVSVPMLIAAIVIVAIANIFVLTNIQTYYATLYQNTQVSSMKALSVYSAVENVSLMFGPILFSYILANNIADGMKLFATASLGCIVLFIFISTIFRDKKKAPV